MGWDPPSKHSPATFGGARNPQILACPFPWGDLDNHSACLTLTATVWSLLVLRRPELSAAFKREVISQLTHTLGSL